MNSTDEIRKLRGSRRRLVLVITLSKGIVFLQFEAGKDMSPEEVDAELTGGLKRRIDSAAASRATKGEDVLPVAWMWFESAADAAFLDMVCREPMVEIAVAVFQIIAALGAHRNTGGLLEWKT